MGAWSIASTVPPCLDSKAYRLIVVWAARASVHRSNQKLIGQGG